MNLGMNPTDITSKSIRSLIKLLHKKELLLRQVRKIEAQPEALLSGRIVGGIKKIRRPSKGQKSRASSGKGSKEPKAESETLGKRVLAALEDAGTEGISVKDLAEKLKVRNSSLYVWFSISMKVNPAIKRIGPAIYALKST